MIEMHYSIVNNFQVSPEVEDYLKQTRGNTRRALDAADAAFILGLSKEQAYYIDGEFRLLEFFVHRGLTDRIDIGLGVSYIHYGGQLLDQTIYTVSTMPPASTRANGATSKTTGHKWCSAGVTDRVSSCSIARRAAA